MIRTPMFLLKLIQYLGHPVWPCLVFRVHSVSFKKREQSNHIAFGLKILAQLVAAFGAVSWHLPTFFISECPVYCMQKQSRNVQSNLRLVYVYKDLMIRLGNNVSFLLGSECRDGPLPASLIQERNRDQKMILILLLLNCPFLHRDKQGIVP